MINKNEKINIFNEFDFGTLLKLHDDINDDKLAKCIKLTSRSRTDEFYSLIKKYVKDVQGYYNYTDKQLAELYSKKLNIKVLASTIWGWCGESLMI